MYINLYSGKIHKLYLDCKWIPCLNLGPITELAYFSVDGIPAYVTLCFRTSC